MEIEGERERERENLFMYINNTIPLIYNNDFIL